ncbi:MAG: outer membrane lipoprotein-sorting protein, partial [Gammaproteobacteria bacterium]
MMVLLPAVAAVQLSAGAIVARVKDTEIRVRDVEATLTLEIEADGDTKTRKFTLALKRDGVDYRALVSLEAPRAMAGTKFLIHAARGKRNREWAFFPDLDLVRPISGKHQDDPFLNSDVTYADLAGGAHLDDLRHELLGEELVDGEACFVLEGTPRRTIAYGKLRGFVRKSDFVTIK